MKTPNSNLMQLLDAVDACGKIAARLIAEGLSAGDVKVAVKRRFGVKITDATARKIMAAVLIVW